MDLLLGIDLGTGSTKGVLVDTSGVVLASETIAHSMELPRPGWAEVDAEELWWREVCSISAALTAQLPPGATVAGGFTLNRFCAAPVHCKNSVAVRVGQCVK